MEFLAELHPKIIHFPIAFFILYFLFESSGIILKKEFLLKSALIILILAIISSVLAVLTGNQAYEIVKQRQTDTLLYKDVISQHELFATITLWYFMSVMFLRIYFVVKKKFVGKNQYLFIVLGLIGSLLIFLTGSYGGELVFKYGIGTKIF
ncbi:MAG: DUF2231 domain-containing protein [Melioribacter sp.]|nr:DUF2231 domain-containing protein [Melioribacter sp.]